jgi:hypothetical protein
VDREYGKERSMNAITATLMFVNLMACAAPGPEAPAGKP